SHQSLLAPLVILLKTAFFAPQVFDLLRS
ncbi:hypothetical protein D041_0516B, partial [Vibrio parahaemolyticus EKP-008]